MALTQKLTKLILALTIPCQAEISLQTKEKIAHQHHNLESASRSLIKSQCHFELAQLYLKDQELDLAFVHFLEALRMHSKASAPPLSFEEARLYEPALEEYLKSSGSMPKAAAEQLIACYQKAADENPQFVYLNFLLAVAHANLEEYEAFFTKFYCGYPLLHDTFLAYKTQGVLNLRLAHHAGSEALRKKYTKAALDYLHRALEKNGKDPGLYKILVIENGTATANCQLGIYLKELVAHKVVLPRSDICFYVEKALVLGDIQMAQEIISLAKKNYSYSRAILDAEELVLRRKENAT